jgi:hypothetical protein
LLCSFIMMEVAYFTKPFSRIFAEIVFFSTDRCA